MINDYKTLSAADRRRGPRRGLHLLVLAGGISLAAVAIAYLAPAGDGEPTAAPTPEEQEPLLAEPAPQQIPLTLPALGDDTATATEAAASGHEAEAVADTGSPSPSEQNAADDDTGSFRLSLSGGEPETETLSLEESPSGEAPVTAEAEPEETLSIIETAEQILAETTAPEPAPTVEESSHWIEEKVRKGDSLSRIFSRLGLSASLLHRIVNSSKEAKQLARIRPGQILKVKLDKEGNLLALIHQRSPIESLQVLAREDGDGFDTRIVERGLETRVATATGTITSSLYEGAKRAGLSDELIMELANIFGWDIDFALEIRAGDRFSVIYEEEYLDGKKYDNGPILAAEFVNHGKTFRAVRYQDEEGNVGYYSPDGRSMRKAFLRAPVDFRRISSRFTKARWHPVLGKKRPHRGVDYSAAIGTPIKAAGDGRVIFRGRKGGYGNAIIIQHGSQYTTLYAHMSKFNRKVKKGTRVKQGQVIGYVGKSGLATGPHLHYEFRVNGVHRNPLTVKIPAAKPLPRKYRDDFTRKSAALLAELDTLSHTMLAEAN